MNCKICGHGTGRTPWDFDKEDLCHGCRKCMDALSGVMEDLLRRIGKRIERLEERVDGILGAHDDE